MIQKSSISMSAPATSHPPGVPEPAQEYGLSILHSIGWPAGSGGEGPVTLGITSSTRGEGVSTVAAQVALAAASAGDQRILLVDANFDGPSVHSRFSADLAPGLADTLLGSLAPQEAVQSTSLVNLAVLTAGCSHGNLSAMYGSSRLPEAIDRFKQAYGLVVIDLPALTGAGAAVRLAGMLDGVILVVEAERVQWEAAQRTALLLQRGSGRLLGAVLNKQHDPVPAWLSRWLW